MTAIVSTPASHFPSVREDERRETEMVGLGWWRAGSVLGTLVVSSRILYTAD